MDSPAHNREPSGIEPDRARKTLVIGLGSPILRDDAIGLHVARALAKRLPADRFSVLEAGAAGLRLLPLLDGWRAVIFVDALFPPGPRATPPQPGRLRRLSIDSLGEAVTLSNSHEAGLAETLILGRRLGMAMPDEVIVYGVEVEDPFTFDDSLSPSLAAQVEALVETIARECAGPDAV